jgi:hypothetical protein
MAVKSFSRNRHIINAAALLLFIGFNSYIRYKENIVADDTLMQIASAEAWRQGYGVSILFADARDLAQVAPRMVEFWPPGYAVLTGIILQVTGSLKSANLLVDIIGIIFFFTGWYLISKRLIPFTVPYFPALLMLPWAFGFLLNRLPTTDLLALASYIFSMACLIEWVARPNKSAKAFWLVLCAATAFGACFIRFAYYPLAFVPAGVVLLGAVTGNRGWWRPGLVLLGLTALLVGGQVLYQQFIAGSLNYVTERHAASEPQIHWYNLRRFAPFLTKAIAGANLLPLSEGKTDLLLFVGLIVGCIGIIRVTRKFNAEAQRVIFVWLGVALAAFMLNIAFMILLSLRYPPEKWGPWTYVQEVRYFGLNMAIASSLVMLFAFWRDSPWPKYVRYGLVAISLVIFAHGYAYGNFKSAVPIEITPNEPLELSAVLRKWVQNSPGRVVLATDQVHDYWSNERGVASMGMYGAMAGASFCHIDHLIQSRYRSKPITVLVAIVSTPPAGLEQFYREHQAQQIDTLGQIPLMRLTLPATGPVPSTVSEAGSPVH